MNIEEAKVQMKQAVSIYLKKDRYGNYRIPIQRQRPVFLVGAPGIGKTAVVEQIAKELDIGLVSYSMTHHTRQSALGLPFISHKEYKNESFDISEYTMSEIIASIYEVMMQSGKEEGILFLDEINCVSETLAPSMLQFLQYKTFGRHSVPAGWIIVTAGNPQEYNRSVREFDVVTLDRLKVLEVEPSYEIWRGYALNKGVHKAILTYLDIKKDDFYLIETTVDGRGYVTARGWEDLSEAICLNEECGYPVDEVLIGQYLRNKRIVREFAAYYDLYRKYRQDYRVPEIINGEADRQIYQRAKNAQFDERLSLIGLLLEPLQKEIHDNMQAEDSLRLLLPVLKRVKEQLFSQTESQEVSVEMLIRAQVKAAQEQIEKQEAANSLSQEERNGCQFIINTLTEYLQGLKKQSITEPQAVFTYMKKDFDGQVAQMKAQAAEILEKLHHVIQFTEKAFGEGNELLVLITELTVDFDSTKFITRNGCEDYFKYNNKFMLQERNEKLLQQIEELEQEL